MKKSLKKTVVVMAAVALSTAAVGINQLRVFADEETAIQPLDSVAMVEGASVRIGDTSNDNGNGMRFTMFMDKAAYETLMTGDTYSEQEFGIIIVPDLDAYDDVSYDTVFGAQKKYDWAVWEDDGDGSGRWVYNGTDDDDYSQIMLYSFDKMYNSVAGMASENESNVYVRGTISKISYAAQEFRGIGYVKYKDGEAQKYVFLEPEVRSMTYVAQRAVENDHPNADWLQSAYVADYGKNGEKATATTVTQEYYYEQANGSYVKNDEDTVVISTVGEDSIYVDDEVEADSAHKIGYVYYPEHGDSVASAKAYANGKRVLKSYYKLFDVANVVDDVSLLTAKRTNYYADVHGTLTIAKYGENVSDRLNESISINAQYKIDLPKESNALGDASVALQLSSEFMSKSALQEMITEGYDSLSFYAYRQLNMGSDTWENGLYIRTLDFDKMRADSPKVSDDRKTIETKYCSQQESFSSATNTWRKIEYSLTDLLEFYDVLFGSGTNYYLAEIGAGTNNVDDNVLYFSKFALNNIDVSGVVMNNALFRAKLNTWWDGGKNMNTSGLSSVKVESYNQSVANRAESTSSKVATYKIGLPSVDDPASNTTTMVSLSREFMPKAVLQKLVNDGYKTLDFAVYRQYDIENDGWDGGMYLRTLDFTKMKTESTETNFKLKSYSEVLGLMCNRWVSISYQLSDLIEFYDVLFAWNGDYFIFEIGNGIGNRDNNNVYISAFEINK